MHFINKTHNILYEFNSINRKNVKLIGIHKYNIIITTLLFLQSIIYGIFLIISCKEVRLY